MHITLCAKSKILQLTETGKCFRIKTNGSTTAGSHIDLIPNAEMNDFDITISHIPKVVADIETINSLLNQNIDFDYNTGDFIISNRGAE